MFDFIGRHWRGENSLSAAYFGNGTLLFPACALIVALIWFVFGVLLHPALAILVSFAFGIAYSVWWSVGTWRSAGRAIEQAEAAQPKGSAGWARTARFVIAIGPFVLVYLIYLTVFGEPI